ncbi:hypothetical protein [Paenibacillus sp. NPDC057967]|uniref:hypothetical protein n=1 Tax=Paenibacillus sp. NPDC057967 TaxID=3346293 RepID=UPI0036D7616E
MFGNHDIASPVKQSFVWVAEYLDGTCLSEFDYKTQEENNYYKIDRKNLLRFGLVGNGASMFFEVYGGVFKILGQMLEVSYVTDDKTYQLTGRAMMYNDIITYKDAEFLFNPTEPGSGQTAITQFNFGYKVKLNIDGVDFHLKAICQIPNNRLTRLELTLVASEELNGRLEIKRNGRSVDVIDAPLTKDVGGTISWELR